MKIFTGTVINTNKAKTATVVVDRIVAHPVYGKRMKRTKKYHVHDENSTAKVGEVVNFVASKPFSKTKKWALIERRVRKSKKKGETKK